jgi:tyrosine-protein phosphatase SIW14
MRLSFVTLLLAGAAGATAHAQQVTKEAVPGITNFARVQTTVACAGAVEASAVPDIKKLGFASIINLRQASEQGANVEGEGAAAKAVGLNYFNIPFNAAAPDPNLVPNFLAAVTTPANQPAFIHCAAGGRAASMWLIKRLQVDGWDEPRAVEEATALGLTNERLKQFALDWVQTHKK